MRIRDILRVKGDRVITISPDHSVHQAMQAMMRHQIGALVVEAEVIVGIITERDILGFATRTPDAVDRVAVADVMTRDVIV
ncbi:MAG: CBS domain-containing protein, partial [Gammaproteobacteria bacterium]|nr:CBS domain-containing protein [Gemmatimonadota bacterium]NIR35434.1 CBS domain-containing protein [Actinomycetota bacterium]NIU73100.1 CBS domain-containing protein [Gammaproteobacteria bacterium]NIY07596.1 CBS domain-containing protein [Gemmatimonadota bacterium]